MLVQWNSARNKALSPFGSTRTIRWPLRGRESDGRQNKRRPADHRCFRPVSSWKQQLADLALPEWHGKPSRRAGRPRACGCPVIFTVLRYGRYPQPEGGGETWSVVRLAQKKAQADLITGCAGRKFPTPGLTVTGRLRVPTRVQSPGNRRSHVRDAVANTIYANARMQ